MEGLDLACEMAEEWYISPGAPVWAWAPSLCPPQAHTGAQAGEPWRVDVQHRGCGDARGRCTSGDRWQLRLVRETEQAAATAAAQPPVDGAGRGWCAAVVVGMPAEAMGSWLVARCHGIATDMEGQGGSLGALRHAAVWLDWRQLRPRRQSEPLTGGPQAARSPTSVCGESRSTGSRLAAGGSGYGGSMRAPPNEAKRKWLRAKLESECARNWDVFYRDHTVNFFKDRHWLDREFPQINEAIVRNADPRALGRAAAATTLLVECGCGVGNAMFPLLASHPTLQLCGVDLSRRAVDFVRANPAYHAAVPAGRCQAWVADLAELPLAEVGDARVHSGDGGSVDVLLLCFVLSAVPPHKHRQFLRHVAPTLKPDGVLLFRDYCDGDMAQRRFRPAARLSAECEEYVRHDGTLSYFFREAEMAAHARAVGLVVESSEVIAKQVLNRKEGKVMDRRWLQLCLRHPQPTTR
jgi:methyltransferase-like protein 6